MFYRYYRNNCFFSVDFLPRFVDNIKIEGHFYKNIKKEKGILRIKKAKNRHSLLSNPAFSYFFFHKVFKSYWNFWLEIEFFHNCNKPVKVIFFQIHNEVNI